MQCCICGIEVIPDVNGEIRFTGRRKAICYECIQNGLKQVSYRKTDYFYGTDEGKSRLRNSRKKRKQK